jgi:hypothetical protein
MVSATACAAVAEIPMARRISQKRAVESRMNAVSTATMRHHSRVATSSRQDADHAGTDPQEGEPGCRHGERQPQRPRRQRHPHAAVDQLVATQVMLTAVVDVSACP